MDTRALLVLFLIGLCLSAAVAKKPRKFKKAYEGSHKKLQSLQEKLDKLQQEEDELEEEIGEELQLEEDEEEELDLLSAVKPFSYEEQIVEEELQDPCQELFCGPGRECIITEDGEGKCQCIETCEEIEDNRRKVCSNFNNTWSSDCELYRMRCICSEGSPKCLDQRFEHIHIDYYGACQKLPECTEEESVDFPRRMREWLFNIMRDMADREELSEHYKKLEQMAEDDEAKKLINAAVWKWCELDGHPKDRSVSRHELFPLRAPLYTLEQCIAPFLDSCDPDGDHKITLKEWTKCLDLSEEQVEDMEDLCEDIQDD